MLRSRSNSIYGTRSVPYQIVGDYRRRRLNPLGSGNTLSGGPSMRRGIRGRLARGRVRTLTRRRTRTSNGILGGTNADTRLVYRKKRMPSGKRRRWKRFVQKVNFVGERDLGTRTVLYNDTITTFNSNNTYQGCLTLCLYPFVNASKSWLNDLGQIGIIENTGNPTAALGGTVDPNTKVMFHSAVMDVTIRNTSTYNNGTSDVQTSEAALELDVYELYLRENANSKSSTNVSFSAILDEVDDPDIGGAGAGYECRTRGATPFEFGTQLGRYGVKVLKKTKYFIPNGQTITYQARDPKRHVCRYLDLTETDGWNKKGWTRVYYIIYKLVPGLTRGTTAGTYKDQITVGLTRKYMYKIEGFNDSRERYFSSTVTAGNPT